MSKTPRTDEVWDNFSESGHVNHDAVFKHARELEEEIASLKDANAFLTDTYETRIGTLESHVRHLEGNANKLQIAYDEAETALREIHMSCGNPDPADGEGTTPQEVKESVESIIQERNQLLSTFRHTHVNNGTDDTCKKCGLDLRHPIHERIVGDWGFKDGEEYPK